jgi:ATP:ADP antiporter, AAA family
LAGVVVAVATVGQLVMGKAVRDGFFLSNFEVELLPRMMIVAAIASFASVLGVSRAMTRFSPFRVVPTLFGAAALLLVGQALLSQTMPRVSAVALYLHMAVFGSTAVSGFWSLVNERYDPHTAKRVVSRLASGAAIGGILGGLVAWQAASRMPVSTLLYMMGGLNLACLFGVLGIGNPSGPTTRDVRTPGDGRATIDSDARTGSDAPAHRLSLFAGLESLRHAPYLRQLASLVVVTSIASALMDYFLGIRAKAMYDNSADLLSFFALYQLGIGVLSFVVLSVLSRPSLKNLGLAGTVALLPGSVVLGGIFALALPGLSSAVVMRGADAVMRNSLFRSGYELLFTPIAAEKKRATKLIIDVAFDRIGTAAGSGLALAVVFIATSHTERVIAGMVVVLSFLGLWIAIRLNGGYVSALEESLRVGSVKLDEGEVVDATTWRTLTQTNLQLDRRKILEEIERLRRESAETETKDEVAAADDLNPPASLRGAPSPRSIDDPLLQAIADLRGRDVARARKILASAEPIDIGLVAHVVPLLAHKVLRHDALHALRKVAHRANGQLVDALLDTEAPVVVRRRMARVLCKCPTQRTVDGLLAGLTDKRFEVRFQCGVALWTIAESAPALSMPRALVLDAARREVDVEREVWEAQAKADVEESHEDSVLDDMLSERKSRSLEHVFRILSLTLERGPLMLALRALEGDDPRLRGTSLEYLENVLPDDIRRRLWPFLDDRRPKTNVPTRNRKDVLEELLASGADMNVESVRRSLKVGD